MRPRSVAVLVGAQDLGPLVDLALEILGEKGGPGAARREYPDLVEPLAHAGVGERGLERRSEGVDRFLRRTLRQVHADPGGRLVAFEAELVEGRSIREELPALQRRDRDRAQCAGLDVVGQGRQPHHRQPPGDQVGLRLRRGAVGDVADIDAGHRLEQRAGEVASGAAAIAAGGQLARMRLEIGHQRRIVGDRHVLVHQQHLRRVADDRDWLHVVLHVHGELGIELAEHADGGTDGERGVAVGRRLDERVDRDRGAAARLVLHHHRTAERLRHVIGDDAGGDIDDAAGARGADHGDGPFRIDGGRGRDGGGQDDERGNQAMHMISMECIGFNEVDRSRRRELLIRAGGGERRHDAVGRQRHLREAHAERRQRILDGGDDRRRRRNGAAFARALDAERIERVRRLHVLDPAARHVRSGGQEIILEARRQRLRARVVFHELEQCIADAVRDPALHLAVHDQRVDHVAAVVRHHVVDERDAAGEGIDLHLDHVGAVAIRRLRRREIGRVLEAGRLSRRERESWHALRGARQLAERHRRPVAAAGGGAAVLDVDVAFSHAQHAGGERDGLRAHCAARDQRR